MISALLALNFRDIYQKPEAAYHTLVLFNLMLPNAEGQAALSFGR
jgi:hypothetical protein